MTEVYYVQNETQYRQLLVRLAIEKDKDPDDLQDLGICGCNYKLDEEGDRYWDCCDKSCETDACCFMQHKNDVDVANHIAIEEIKVEFPFIFVLADAYSRDERVTLVSVKEAKENTKYGYDYDCRRS